MFTLLFTIFLPIIGIILLLFLPSSKITTLHQIAFYISLINFIISLFLWIQFDKLTTTFQFIYKLGWIPFINIDIYLGIDGISLFFILLTTFLIPLCILISRNSIKVYIKEYLISFLLLEFLLILVFSVLDLILFYIFFESILIPMFIIIGIWGSRERKI